MSFSNLFLSPHLTYRAITPSDTTTMHKALASDPDSYAQSTNRLLRPLTPEDTAKSSSGMSDSLLAVMICLRPGVGVEASSKGESEEGNVDESTPIGWLSLDAHPVARHHRSCSLGITVVKEWQGKGYGAEAIKWALDWAFKVAGVHAVRLTCFSFNERALRLYQRLGFVREGVNREAYYYNCKWYDRVHLSMLESEWVALKES